ncbi:MAG: DbpA RNA binding domain-containing protein, partial [Prolixibacteraceae bacterium]|nr:DbpA RNA binding domain-containing protein [Prolixibacteraceae bacterium]
RFYINVGTKKGMDVPGLIGLIKETTRDRNIPIGKIDLMKKFSFFEVDKSNAPLILDSFKNVSHGSERILVEESKPFAPGMGFEKPKSGSPEDFKLKKKKKDFGKNDRKKRSWN